MIATSAHTSSSMYRNVLPAFPACIIKSRYKANVFNNIPDELSNRKVQMSGGSPMTMNGLDKA